MSLMYIDVPRTLIRRKVSLALPISGSETTMVVVVAFEGNFVFNSYVRAFSRNKENTRKLRPRKREGE